LFCCFIEVTIYIKIGYVKEPSTQRNICFFNRARLTIKKYWNDKLNKERDLFISESDNDEQTQDMYIYEGMPVIAKKKNGMVIFCYSQIVRLLMWVILTMSIFLYIMIDLIIMAINKCMLMIALLKSLEITS
jgi:hypothetical protein